MRNTKELGGHHSLRLLGFLTGCPGRNRTFRTTETEWRDENHKFPNHWAVPFYFCFLAPWPMNSACWGQYHRTATGFKEYTVSWRLALCPHWGCLPPVGTSKAPSSDFPSSLFQQLLNVQNMIESSDSMAHAHCLASLAITTGCLSRVIIFINSGCWNQTL